MGGRRGTSARCARCRVRGAVMLWEVRGAGNWRDAVGLGSWLVFVLRGERVFELGRVR